MKFVQGTYLICSPKCLKTKEFDERKIKAASPDLESRVFESSSCSFWVPGS